MSSVSADVVQEPINALIHRLEVAEVDSGSTRETPANHAAKPEITTADAAAIVALPMGAGFGVYAVVVTLSDPVTAAVWAVAATIATVMLMRYGSTNRALKVIASWIANPGENDKTK